MMLYFLGFNSFVWAVWTNITADNCLLGLCFTRNALRDCMKRERENFCKMQQLVHLQLLCVCVPILFFSVCATKQASGSGKLAKQRQKTTSLFSSASAQPDPGKDVNSNPMMLLMTHACSSCFLVFSHQCTGCLFSSKVLLLTWSLMSCGWKSSIYAH